MSCREQQPDGNKEVGNVGRGVAYSCLRSFWSRTTAGALSETVGT